MVTIIKSLPKKAGKAKINWDEKPSEDVYNPNPHSHHDPIRKGENIILPLLEDAVYLPLANGEQFLFKLTREVGGYLEKMTTGYWFGGTDEEPFLVQIERDAFNTFTNNGEEAFYRSIKPFFVDFLEKILNTEAERQGDIFAVPIGERKDKGIESLLTQSYIHKKYSKLELEKAQGNLFGTRHVLEGHVLMDSEGTPYSIIPEQYNEHNSVLGTGIVKAPDHEVLCLKEELVYFMAQTRYLAHPEEAD